VKRYGQYGRKASWIVKKIWKIRKKSRLNSEMIWSSIFSISFQFNLHFFRIFHIFSLFNLLFFHNFHIFSLNWYFKRCDLKKYGKLKCVITSCTRKASSVAFQTLRFEKVRGKKYGKMKCFITSCTRKASNVTFQTLVV
jgi:hypothetical protein